MNSTAWGAAAAAPLVLALIGCGQGAGTGTSPTPEAETEAEPWDLIYISDSSAWGVPRAYADLAAEALDREVRVNPVQVPQLTMLQAEEIVKGDPEAIGQAEIIVLWASPVGLPIDPGWQNCKDPLTDPGPYTVEDWAPYEEAIGRTIDAIWDAREGRPTVLRVTDIYVPVYDQWKEAGIYDACRLAMETQSEAVRSAAEAHGATMVSAYDVYNGEDHEEDPVDKGYIGGDGIHPTPAGSQAMAEALAATGFEPTQP